MWDVLKKNNIVESLEQAGKGVGAVWHQKNFGTGAWMSIKALNWDSLKIISRVAYITECHCTRVPLALILENSILRQKHI